MKNKDAHKMGVFFVYVLIKLEKIRCYAKHNTLFLFVLGCENYFEMKGLYVILIFVRRLVMRVDVIGTSCTWFTRNNTSYVIDGDIILDTPEGSYKSIIQAMDMEKTRCIFISHLHTDHWLDLHIFTTQTMRFPGSRTEKLRVYAPKGTLDSLIKLNEICIGAPDELDKECVQKWVEFIDLYDGMEIVEGEYNIKVYKMEHGDPETYGFAFKDKNGMVVGFPTDTTVCDNLHKILKQSKYAFLELSAIKPHPKHINIDQFVELSETYKDTKIFVVHTNDKTQKYAEENGFNTLHDMQVLNLE